MAEQNFSWLPDESLGGVQSPQSDVIFLGEKKNKHLEKILEYKTPLIVCSALLIALILMKVFQDKEVVKPFRLESMVAVMAIPKGQIVEGMLLRPVLITPDSISKGQRLELLTMEHAEKVMGKIRAKKDIPPNKPIFWNELELVAPPKPEQKINLPTVIYSEDSK